MFLALRRISCHGRNYSQPYFFKRNQSSDNRSHCFGAKFLLRKLSASDFSYERKSAFTPGPILLKMSGLNSVASEIAIKKLLFLGRLITEPNMAPTARNLFQCRVESYFDTNVTSAGVLLSISEALVKYDLFHHFSHGITAPHFHLMKN